jgi:hypothetical protein
MKTADKIVPRFGQPCLAIALALEQLGAALAGTVNITGLPANET